MDDFKKLSINGNLNPLQLHIEKGLIRKENRLIFSATDELAKDKLVEAIMFYIALQYKNDCLGFGKITLQDFSDVFGYSKNFLTNTVKNPLQFQRLSPEEISALRADASNANNLWVNRFENALYSLANISYTVATTEFKKDGTPVSTVKHINILDSIEKEQDPKHKQKVIYYYKINEYYRRNLQSLYLVGEVSSIKKLLRSGLTNLYTFLLSVRSATLYSGSLQSNPDNCSLEKYFELAEVPKYYVKGNEMTEYPLWYKRRELNRALKKIWETTELFDKSKAYEESVIWEKNKESGIIDKVYFVFNKTDEYRPLDSKYALKDYLDKKRHTFFDNLMHDFLHYMISEYTLNTHLPVQDEETFKNFLKWCFSEKEVSTDEGFFSISIDNCYPKRSLAYKERLILFFRKYFKSWEGTMIEFFDKMENEVGIETAR